MTPSRRPMTWGTLFAVIAALGVVTACGAPAESPAGIEEDSVVKENDTVVGGGGSVQQQCSLPLRTMLAQSEEPAFPCSGGTICTPDFQPAGCCWPVQISFWQVVRGVIDQVCVSTEVGHVKTENVGLYATNFSYQLSAIVTPDLLPVEDCFSAIQAALCQQPALLMSPYVNASRVSAFNEDLGVNVDFSFTTQVAIAADPGGCSGNHGCLL